MPVLSRLSRRQRALGVRGLRVRSLGALALLAIVCLIAAVMAVTTLYDHDEEMFAASVVLIRSHRLYGDFIYLQTPVYPVVLSWLMPVAPGRVFFDLRCASGVGFVLVCLCGFWICFVCRRVWRAAMGAVLLMCTMPLLQNAAGSLRNDVLPCLLLLTGILAAEIAIAARDRTRVRSATLWFLCGVGAALAAGTKISYVFAPVAGLVFLLCRARALGGWNSFTGYCAGCFAGGLPVLWYLWCSPGNFIWDAAVYHLTAPRDWYARKPGLVGMLSFWYKMRLFAETLLSNPPVLAAVILLSWAAAGAYRKRSFAFAGLSDAQGFLGVMLVGAIVCAILPVPAHDHYWLPVFVLAVLLAMCCVPLEAIVAQRAVIGIVMCAGAVWGVARVGQRMPDFVRPEFWITARVERDARGIASALPRDFRGCVATLSPLRVLVAGEGIYPELAAGPFFFRSGDVVQASRVAGLRGVSPHTLAALLALRPPGAVFTGFEGGGAVDLDGVLAGYAMAHGFREVVLPDFGGRLFVNPVPTGGCV